MARLTRLRPSEEGSRYLHPGGFTIWRRVRDWDARPYRGSAGNPQSKITWNVIRSGTSPRRVLESFYTLREARQWCDDQEGYLS